uniref:Coenzyme F420:L-glutamate ligase-like domain-containing protein n=1 Tax=Ignisphaera aggregans TaxID=334771 RepID=A0A7C2VME3_9CREN
MLPRYRLSVKVLRKKFGYWYPGTDFREDIVRKYGRHIDNGDFLVISEKAISTALGHIYDESRIDVDHLSELMALAVDRVLWARLLKFVFKKRETIELLRNTPIQALAVHKKLALRIGGIKHFIKPLSEAGIDASNLPYKYVSLPLPSANSIARSTRLYIFKRLGKLVNVLIIDSDKTFRPRSLKNVAFATRPSEVRGVVDLGGIAYLMGRAMPSLFTAFPTPVGYSGVWVGLPTILRIAKTCERYIGFGLGRNALEMLETLNKESFSEVGWCDMDRVYHYPAVVAKVRVASIS